MFNNQKKKKKINDGQTFKKLNTKKKKKKCSQLYERKTHANKEGRRKKTRVTFTIAQTNRQADRQGHLPLRPASSLSLPSPPDSCL